MTKLRRVRVSPTCRYRSRARVKVRPRVLRAPRTRVEADLTDQERSLKMLAEPLGVEGA